MSTRKKKGVGSGSSSGSRQNSTGNSLSILSVNACCLSGGLRNERLPCLSVSSGVFLFLLLYFTIICFAAFTPSWWDASTQHWVVLLLCFSLPLTFCLGHVFALQMARVSGCVISCCTGKHDFKKQRLASLVKHYFGKYDVVAVQELFDAWPRCLDSKFPDLLIRLAEKEGFHYSVRPHIQCPSVGQSSGLLILSRYRIEESEHYVFKDQYTGDKYAVNRALMFARIELPRKTLGEEENHLNFFTCHVCPQMSNLAKGCPKSIIEKGNYTRSSQFSELSDYISSHSSTNELTVVAGDFNADIQFPNANVIDSLNKRNLGFGEAESGKAMDTVLTHMTKIGLRNAGGLVPTYGYLNNNDGNPVETLLTSVKQRHKIMGDDLIFTNKKCDELDAAFSTVPLVVHSEPFTHLSDHWGISIVLKNVNMKRNVAGPENVKVVDTE